MDPTRARGRSPRARPTPTGRSADARPTRRSAPRATLRAHGIYFWEYGIDRALQFADDQRRRGKVETPSVVGAVLQLGRCYDLTDTQFTRDLAEGYRIYTDVCRTRGLAAPTNTAKLHRLDCAVLNWWLGFLETGQGLRYDSVRCAFVEGAPVAAGARIHHETHLQVAVRNPACILGVFRPVPPAALRTP